MSLTLILLLGLIVLIAQCLEGITGFGSTVLAVPFLAMILGLDEAVMVSATHTLLLTVYIVVVSWKQIVWKEFGFIALYVFLGVPAGFLLFQYLDETYLKMILSLFMIGVGINGLRATWGNRHWGESSTEPVKSCRSESRRSPVMRFVLFLGGVFHGAFASGGPFVVIYASKALKEKALFRVSVCLLWMCLNAVLLTAWLTLGKWTQTTGHALLMTLPFLLLGIFIGDFLHHRVNEYAFRLIVYALLLCTGFVVMYGVAGRLFFFRFVTIHNMFQ